VRLRNIHEFVLDCIASLDWVNGRCIIDFSSTSMKHTDGLVGVFLFTIVGICSAEAVLLCFVTEFLKGLICMRILYPGARSQKSCGGQTIKWTQNWRLDSSFLLKDIFPMLSSRIQNLSRYSYDSSVLSNIFLLG
jgi:hypothetical protein